MTTDLKPTIRTVTVFLNLQPSDFNVSWGSLFSSETIESKLSQAVTLLRAMESELKSQNYIVQTLRIATNPFGEWMVLSEKDREVKESSFDIFNRKKKKVKLSKLTRLERLDQLLDQHKIDFCSVGPAKTDEETKMCIDIVSQSHRFSCSRVVEAGDVEAATIAARTILDIAKLGNKPNAPRQVQDGLGNFRFCAASYCRSGIPFFPAARAAAASENTTEEEVDTGLKFAIGLENGTVALDLLKRCKSVANIRTTFAADYAALLKPIQSMCQKVAKIRNATFLGIDTSLNPSLDETGSVAAAMEQLDEVSVFGGPGTLGAAAEITKVLQSLEDIQRTGYCGLMLPVCEDTRLAELTEPKGSSRLLRVYRYSQH